MITSIEKATTVTLSRKEKISTLIIIYETVISFRYEANSKFYKGLLDTITEKERRELMFIVYTFDSLMSVVGETIKHLDNLFDDGDKKNYRLSQWVFDCALVFRDFFDDICDKYTIKKEEVIKRGKDLADKARAAEKRR